MFKHIRVVILHNQANMSKNCYIARIVKDMWLIVGLAFYNMPYTSQDQDLQGYEATLDLALSGVPYTSQDQDLQEYEATLDLAISGMLYISQDLYVQVIVP